LLVSWEDGDRVFCRGLRPDADGNSIAVLSVIPAGEHPSPATLDRFANEYGLKDELNEAWAVRPLELRLDHDRGLLVLDDPGGEPLERLLGAPMELGRFLHLAVDMSVALGQLHQRDLIHKDIKPANILVNCRDEHVRFTGFGIASRPPRERQAPEPPEFIAGTLAYMAPEQTGRMNRSIDALTDLYALGVTFYRMVTGGLPFAASDPMDWVHCHIARKPVPPSERAAAIPAPVSAIIVNLRAKTAEERYQTAAGLARDLRRCQAEWESSGAIGNFALGEQDFARRANYPREAVRAGARD
jgi:serine/threonine protein kinase